MNAPAETLYQLCLTHSRDPQLFLTGGVEDTLDGRFDSLCPVCWVCDAGWRWYLINISSRQNRLHSSFLTFSARIWI